MKRIKAITDAVVAAAVKAVGCPPSASAPGGRPCGLGEWSTTTTELTNASIQNVVCKDVAIGVQHTTRQDPCCVLHAIVDALAGVLADMTSEEQAAFLQQGLGIAKTTPISTASDVKSALMSHFASGCGAGMGSISSAVMNNILFAASSKTTCDQLMMLITSASSSAVCIIDGVSTAQAKVWPKSSRKRPRGSTVAVTIGVVLGVCAVVCLVGLVFGRRRRRPPTIGAIRIPSSI